MSNSDLFSTHLYEDFGVLDGHICDWLQCLGQTIERIYIEYRAPTGTTLAPVDSTSCRGFVTTTRARNVIAGVCVPYAGGRRRSAAMERRVLIFCQPNSSCLATWLDEACDCSLWTMSNRLGVDIYAFDYSGFGMSTGQPTEANLYLDVEAVYEFVRAERADCTVSGSVIRCVNFK